MKGGHTVSQEILDAWDLYADGRFDELVQLESHSVDAVRDLAIAARMERDEQLVDEKPASQMFAALIKGQQAYYAGNPVEVVHHLGGWLKDRNYYTHTIVERFLDACINSERYSDAINVGLRFLDSKPLQGVSVFPLFLAYYCSDKFAEALKVYDRFESMISQDPDMIQRVGLAALQTGQYERANRLLFDVYTRITGSDYEEDMKRRYQALASEYDAKSIDKLMKKKDRSMQETLELGLGFLFQSRYTEARTILEGMLRVA